VETRGRGPVLLVAGGSGVVPLMAMIRSRDGASATPFRLIYSVRTAEDRIYDHELRRRASEDGGLEVAFLYTRIAPDGETRSVGRITA
jgi:ferredoxin-NADP reductase